MSLLQNLQNMLGQAAGQISGATGGGAPAGGQNPFSNLSGLLGPAALGGLMGAIMGTKSGRKVAGSALLIGGGALLGKTLWDKYKGSIASDNAGRPGFGAGPSAPDERAQRIVRALIFAAKSDGHIDAREQKAIEDKVRELGLGQEAEALIHDAVEQPLDPALLAQGITTEEEALELYLVSCAVIDIDHFMERSYLEALGTELKIPADLQKELEKAAQEIKA